MSSSVVTTLKYLACISWNFLEFLEEKLCKMTFSFRKWRLSLWIARTQMIWYDGDDLLQKKKNDPKSFKLHTDLIQLLQLHSWLLFYDISKKKAVKKWSYPSWLILFPNFLPQWWCQQCQNQSWCAWMKKTFWRDKNTSYSVVPRTITKTLALSKKKEKTNKIKICNTDDLWWSHSENAVASISKTMKI